MAPIAQGLVEEDTRGALVFHGTRNTLHRLDRGYSEDAALHGVSHRTESHIAQRAASNTTLMLCVQRLLNKAS